MILRMNKRSMFMKRYLRLYICILWTVVLSIVSVNRVMADEKLYLSYYSADNGLDMQIYDDTSRHYITLMDDEDGKWYAEMYVTIRYEYSDGAWVKVEGVYVNVYSCNGCSISIGDQYIYNTYGIRYITVKTPDNRSIEYAIKGYADSYGDTEVYYEIVNR